MMPRQLFTLYSLIISLGQSSIIFWLSATECEFLSLIYKIFGHHGLFTNIWKGYRMLDDVVGGYGRIS